LSIFKAFAHPTTCKAYRVITKPGNVCRTTFKEHDAILNFEDIHHGPERCTHIGRNDNHPEYILTVTTKPIALQHLFTRALCSVRAEKKKD
jgi:hypothetical protein